MQNKTMLLYLLFWGIAGINAPLVAQTVTDFNTTWSVPLQVRIRSNIFSLKLGGRENASTGFDNGIDVITAPPAFNPYAFLFIDAFPNFLKEDYRSLDQEQQWILRIVNASSDSSTISWNASELPAEDELFLNNTIDMSLDSIARFYGNKNLTILYKPHVSSVNQPSIDVTIGSFKLFQNYPNPFNSSTTIAYQLPIDTQVCLKIYNLSGQEMQALVDEYQEAGYHQVNWEGKDKCDNKVTSGIYLFAIETRTFQMMRKMIMIE